MGTALQNASVGLIEHSLSQQFVHLALLIQGQSLDFIT
jgi:hypothetical protein